MMLRRSTNRGRCSTQAISGEEITSPQGRAGGLPAPAPHPKGAAGPAQPQQWHRWAQLSSGLPSSWSRALCSAGSWEKSEEEEEEEEEALGFAMGAQNCRG